MEKEFVPHELSLRMKLIGFNEPCLAYYSKYNDSNRPPHLAINFKHSLKSNSYFRYLQTRPSGEGLFIGIDEGGCACPFITQAFRWFREKYDMAHQITYAGAKGRYNAFTDDWVYDSNGELKEFSYEEAELACLDKLIEIVESKSE